MKTPSLREVGARLEKAYGRVPFDPTDAEGAYEQLESLAIAILDSGHEDFIPGELEEYLETQLYLFRLEHNLVPFPIDRD